MHAHAMAPGVAQWGMRAGGAAGRLQVGQVEELELGQQCRVELGQQSPVWRICTRDTKGIFASSLACLGYLGYLGSWFRPH